MLNYIYIIRLIIILMASGCLIYNSRLFREIPDNNRFLVGFTSAPLFIALYDYLLGLVWPGAPAFLFRYGVVIGSIFYLFYHKNYLIIQKISRGILESIVKFLKEFSVIDRILFAGIFLLSTGAIFAYMISGIAPSLQKIINIAISAFVIGIVILVVIILLYHFRIKEWKNVPGHFFIVFLGVSGTIILICLSLYSLSYIQDTMPGWDQSHYNMQARYFVEDRNSWEIDNYIGEKEGSILPDDHGPLWEVIIADSEFFAYDSLNSAMIRLCQIIIGLLFYMAMFNFGYILSGVSGGFLSVILIQFFRCSMSNTLRGSREGFRFIALYFFVTFMFSNIKSIILGHERMKKESSSGFKQYIDKITWFCGVMLISYLSLNGHGSNVVIMFSIFIVYTIVTIWKKTGLLEYVLTGAATLAGVMLCLMKNILRYLIEDSFTSSTTWAFRGTPSYDLILQGQEKRQNWDRILSSYTKEEFWLIGCGLISIILICTFCFVKTKKHNQKKNSFMDAIIHVTISAFMLFPVIGVYDFTGYKFSISLVESTRYRMYFLIVFAVLIANNLILWWKTDGALHTLAFVLCPVICAVSLITTISCMYYPSLQYNISGVGANAVTDYHINTSDDIISNYHTEGNIFVSDQVLGYFFRIPTKLGFTEYNHPILAACTEDEIENAIDELDLETFVFSYQDNYYHYEVLPFYNYLQNSDNVSRKKYTLKNKYDIDVYYVHKNIWDRY